MEGVLQNKSPCVHLLMKAWSCLSAAIFSRIQCKRVQPSSTSKISKYDFKRRTDRTWIWKKWPKLQTWSENKWTFEIQQARNPQMTMSKVDGSKWWKWTVELNGHSCKTRRACVKTLYLLCQSTLMPDDHSLWTLQAFNMSEQSADPWKAQNLMSQCVYQQKQAAQIYWKP